MLGFRVRVTRTRWTWIVSAKHPVMRGREADLERALSIAEMWPDHEFDTVNCTSFAAMERLGVREAATFDAHFAIYRFGPDRREAFGIIA